MSNVVYILQNGQKLDARHFCRYLYKKIKKTSEKSGIKFEFVENNIVYCLDDAAIEIIYSLMSGK